MIKQIEEKSFPDLSKKPTPLSAKSTPFHLRQRVYTANDATRVHSPPFHSTSALQMKQNTPFKAQCLKNVKERLEFPAQVTCNRPLDSKRRQVNERKSFDSFLECSYHQRMNRFVLFDNFLKLSSNMTQHDHSRKHGGVPLNLQRNFELHNISRFQYLDENAMEVKKNYKLIKYLGDRPGDKSSQNKLIVKHEKNLPRSSPIKIVSQIGRPHVFQRWSIARTQPTKEDHCHSPICNTTGKNHFFTPMFLKRCMANSNDFKTSTKLPLNNLTLIVSRASPWLQKLELCSQYFNHQENDRIRQIQVPERSGLSQADMQNPLLKSENIGDNLEISESSNNQEEQAVAKENLHGISMLNISSPDTLEISELSNNQNEQAVSRETLHGMPMLNVSSPGSRLTQLRRWSQQRKAAQSLQSSPMPSPAKPRRNNNNSAPPSVHTSPVGSPNKPKNQARRNANSMYLSYWHQRLRASQNFYTNQAQLLKSVADVCKVSGCSAAEAFSALAEFHGDAEEAARQIMQPSFTGELKLVCKVINVQDYMILPEERSSTTEPEIHDDEPMAPLNIIKLTLPQISPSDSQSRKNKILSVMPTMLKKDYLRAEASSSGAAMKEQRCSPFS